MDMREIHFPVGQDLIENHLNPGRPGSRIRDNKNIVRARGITAIRQLHAARGQSLSKEHHATAGVAV